MLVPANPKCPDLRIREWRLLGVFFSGQTQDYFSIVLTGNSNLRYHWSLIVGPKVESENAMGKRFHAKQELAIVDGSYRSVWKYEGKDTRLLPTDMLLVRILVGKVLDMHRLVLVLENTPIRGDESGYERWNCVEWVKEALEAIQSDGKALGTSVVKWSSVRNTAMWYVAKKKSEHRLDGQGDGSDPRAPTWSLLDQNELIA